MYVLDVVGAATAGLRLSAEPVHIGRAPTNDLVLADPAISGRHAAIWVSGGRVFVEDLRSRNGTSIDDAPVRGVTELAPGAVVLLGGKVAVQVRRAEGAGGLLRRWMLEDLATGASYPIRADRFRLGADADADLVVPGAADLWLLVDAEGGLCRLLDDEDEAPLDAGAVLELGGSRLAVRLADDVIAPTMDLAAVWYAYAVEASVDGPGGPAARFEDARREVVHAVSAANRAVLVYVLARQLRDDRRRGLAPARAGWCDDEEVGRAIWGRAAPERQLKVLVCRLRSDLREAGFDPLVIEKRRGAIRLRAETVIVP